MENCAYLRKNPGYAPGIVELAILELHHHMKDNIEIGHLSKFDTFRSNRDQVRNLKNNPYKRL